MNYGVREIFQNFNKRKLLMLKLHLKIDFNLIVTVIWVTQKYSVQF